MKKALIRFNTMNDGQEGFWRVLFTTEGSDYTEEILYTHIEIMGCKVITTKNKIEGVGVKFHICVEYNISTWSQDGDTLILQ
jgi:hypothetical protein